MHRYPAVSGGSGVGSNTSGGVPREIVRPDLGYSAPSTFSVTSRRLVPLAPYTLKCDQEPLSTRLGPPDYFPPTPNCAEESLSRDACQNGYKEIVDGIEESKETLYTLVNQQVWTKPLINKYKETIRKRLNLLSNSQLRKRKAGQVYGVPLSGPLLAKSGQFPEQRNSGEENRKKWIEDLAQHKRLRVLAEHVPHGLRRRPLFEALIKNEVPFLRATWCIKVLYLNQVRPRSIGMSSGGGDKSQQKRVELWTKDVLEYMQSLLDEKVQHGDTNFVALGRDNCALLPLSGTSQQANEFMQGNLEVEDPPLHKKWHYMVQILLLHFSEGLLNRTQVIDWALKQLQEREALDATEMILPIVLEVIDEISTCQTLVRLVVEISLHKLGELCPSGSLPSSSEQPRLHYVATFLAEMLSYLLTVTPDSFVALDCFPFPSYVTEGKNSLALCASDQQLENETGADHKAGRVVGVSGSTKLRKHDLTQSPCQISISSLAARVQRRAASLAKAVNPASLKKNEGIVVQALDKALITGDIHAAYHCMFDDDFCGHDQPPDEWLAKISPWLKRSPFFAGNASLSEVFAVSFLCEWAICEFRDCRKMVSASEQKNSNVRAVCRVHMAASVLYLRSEELEKHDCKTSSGVQGSSRQGPGGRRSKAENYGGSSLLAYFESPGLIHDIIAAWIDQHELRKGEGFERLQLLLLELVRKRLFCPPAYVRKLLVSGVLEMKETSADLERASRHRSLLQHLPSLSGLDMDEDGKRPSDPVLREALRIFRNERQFCLHGLEQRQCRASMKQIPCLNQQQQAQVLGSSNEGLNEPSISRFSRESRSLSGKARRLQKKKMKLMDLKQAVAKCLHFPEWCARDQVDPVPEKLILGQGTVKRQLIAQGSSAEKPDVTPGCEDCGRIKKMKSNEGVSVFLPGLGVSQGEEDGSWWVKKVVKTTADTVKVEPLATIKPPKQPSRGRPKGVRKLSLAQLDAARIEASQGASSSHTCDSKVNCPHHKSTVESNAVSTNKDRKKPSLMHDLKAICSTLSRLRLIDKRAFAIWLDETVHVLIEGGDNVASVSTSLQQQPARSQVNVGSSTPSCERSSTRWQCGEEELATIVCLLDKANDLIVLVRLLLWLLPKANVSIVSSPGQTFKLSAASWNKDSPCKIGESMVLACLRRYENVLLAANLLPEALSAGMQRVALLSPSGLASRVSCASLFAYLHDLYKKYGNFQSFLDWETQWKAANSQRLVVDFDTFKTAESDPKLSLLGVNSPNVGDDRDDCLPSRSIGRFVKVGPYMKDLIRRGFQETINQMVNKERELSTCVKSKEPGTGRWNEGSQAAQNVVTGLVECIKQQAGSAPNGDVQLAAAAASAIVSNFGNAIAIVLENFATSNNSYLGASSNGITMPITRCARRVLQAHVQCLRLLKEALGEKLHRALESALAAEASSMVTSVIGHPSGRPPRSQFQLSPETPDPSSALGDLGAGSNGSTLGRSSTMAAATGAFIVGLVLDDVVALERVTSLLRIKEGLESMQLSKGGGSNPNGMSRVLSAGSAMKGDTMAEAFVFWFRVLIGDCKSVAGGLVADILGESSMVAFLHRQRLLPLSTVFFPAYSLFLIAIRGQHPQLTFSNREETSNQQLACITMGDLLLHDPFREVCLKDTRALYQLLARDSSDFEHASLLDSKGADFFTKVSSMVPSRPRLFLHSLLDCKLPTGLPDDSFPQGRGSIKNQASLVEELVQILDDMHPATFHWQWLELRLLLNEQVFMEKLEAHSMSVAVEAVQAARSAVEEVQKLSESEKNFTEILLTRLLVRPDAAALYSEALRHLGRAFEEYLILQVQWILENSDMLLGRKFLRQQLVEMAQRKKFKLSYGKLKVWEWLPKQVDESSSGLDSIRKTEVTSLEEGEVADEDLDCSKSGNEGISVMANGSLSLRKHFAIERALADLVLPCLARSSPEIYSRFAFQLVKQISDLEEQVTLLSRVSGKSVTAAPEGGLNKRFGARKGPRAGSEMGSPGIGRWTAPVTESSPPSAAALQTSLWLRFRFLLLLLPPIYSDRERSMRAVLAPVLAPVLLRLLGTRFVQESVEAFCCIQGDSGRESDWNPEAAAAAAAAGAGEDLFDRILSVLHALLSSTWAVWLKQKPSAKPFKPVREVPPLDREVVHSMQVYLDHMQLPSMVRVRLQAAMPILAPSPTPIISAGPPQVHAAALSVLQTCVTSMSSSGMLGPVNGSYKPPSRLENNFGKIKTTISQEPDTEIDPWTLLEDANSSSGSGGAGTGVLISSESGSNKACAWLKGAVRVRRTDLTYVGSIDDDS